MTYMADPSDTFVVGSDLPISALANDRIVHASSTVSIRDSATIMNAENVGLLVLQNGNGLAGVVSERDVLRAVAEGIDLDSAALAAASGNTFTRATPSSTVEEVALEMMENYIRHVLITDSDGDLIGVVSVRDLLAVIIG